MSAQPAIRAFQTSPDGELIARHGDLVKRIAYHLVARLPASVDVNDLIQAGILGLIEAARNYNCHRGASFETYAGIRIRGAMLDELRKSDWAPRSVHRQARAIADAIHAIEQATGREARDSEIAGKLGMPLADYHRAAADAAACQVFSYDQHGEDDDGIDCPDPSGTPLQSLLGEEFQAVLASTIADMPEREKMVLSLYYNDQLNLREIGAVLEVSESRVCQIHGQALMRLRARMQSWRDVAMPA